MPVSIPETGGLRDRRGRASIPDAGELRERVKLLHIRPRIERPGLEEPGWSWTEYQRAWAKVEYTNAMAIYATSGVGGREAAFVLRRQRLELDNAILWKGQFCLPTRVTPLGRGHLSVKAALVTPKGCRGVERGSGRAIQFPAVVTEKYLGHSQNEPMAQNEVRLVLVTPKEVALAPGCLVSVGEDDAPYWVKIPHEMDPYKHEYEIGRVAEP